MKQRNILSTSTRRWTYGSSVRRRDEREREPSAPEFEVVNKSADRLKDLRARAPLVEARLVIRLGRDHPATTEFMSVMHAVDEHVKTAYRFARQRDSDTAQVSISELGASRENVSSGIEKFLAQATTVAS
jgi:hypothetical protein